MRQGTLANGLYTIADASAINRLDEWSYDSSEFPKVIFGDEDPGRCGRCHQPVLDAGDTDDDTDEDAVTREVDAAWAELREINDATARVIASWCQSPDAPGLTVFVSTGEIIADTLFRDEVVTEYLIRQCHFTDLRFAACSGMPVPRPGGVFARSTIAGCGARRGPGG